MALDRQKILNELGSVMNQLKNADCGCMGKLFGGGMNSVPGGGDGGHVGHRPCPSESCLPRLNLGTMNPAKLYSDTFNYLNKNLMQPTIKEVYEELKGINNMNVSMNQPSNNQACNRPSPAAAIKAQLLKEAQMNAQKNVSPDLTASSQMNTGEKMIHGNENTVSNMDYNVGMKGDAIAKMTNISNMNPTILSNVNTQGHMWQNMKGGATENVDNPGMISGVVPIEKHIPTESKQLNPMINNKFKYTSEALSSDIMKMMHKNPCSCRMHQFDTNTAPDKPYHGQQTEPNMSPNTMFNNTSSAPQGFQDGRLGYAPMSETFQMNSTNTEKVAVEPMAKRIHDNNHGLGSGVDNLTANQLGISYPNTNVTPGDRSVYQQYLSSQDPMIMYNKQNVKSYFGNQPQSCVAGVDYNKPGTDTEANMISPIYNTIGQPVVEYQTTESGLKQNTSTPHTIRHFWNDPSFYSSVKNTESKTSLMGTPGNAMGNRNQLNHLYNQYKGSQSYTHQAVKPPAFSGSMSVGRFNTPNTTHGNVSQLTPVEKSVGDTVTCNAASFAKPPPVTLGGDVATTPRIQEYFSVPKEPPVVPKSAASRNGLQDIAYTTYNTAPAWSFFRNSRSSPFPA